MFHLKTGRLSERVKNRSHLLKEVNIIIIPPRLQICVVQRPARFQIKCNLHHLSLFRTRRSNTCWPLNSLSKALQHQRKATRIRFLSAHQTKSYHWQIWTLGLGARDVFIVRNVNENDTNVILSEPVREREETSKTLHKELEICLYLHKVVKSPVWWSTLNSLSHCYCKMLYFLSIIETETSLTSCHFTQNEPEEGFQIH